MIHIDLRRDVRKVSTTESERVVDPEITLAMATAALKRINVEPDVQTWDHNGVFWTSRVHYRHEDLVLKKPLLGPVNNGRAPEGKGLTKIQAVTSCLMELIERISLAQVVVREDRTPHVFDCLNLRTGAMQTVLVPQTNSGHCGAGNTYEECVLHGLHETIELATPSTMFKPFRLVDIDRMFPHWPEPLLTSLRILMIPIDLEGLYRMIAVRYPVDGRFDPEIRVVEENGLVTLQQFPESPEGAHSAYCGSAAGLNPALVIQRAVWETFQGPTTRKDMYPGKRKSPPPWIETVEATELPNFETDSVTGDIRYLMQVLGERIYVGAIDLTSPDIGVPVVSVFTDYFPTMSLASRKVTSHFFDLEGLPGAQ